MPILYVSVLTKNKEIITQAIGTKVTGNFNQLVSKNQANFINFGRKAMILDSELSLNYMDQNNYCIVCIKNNYDITDLEAQRFMEATEEMILEFINKNQKERGAGSVVIQ